MWLRGLGVVLQSEGSLVRFPVMAQVWVAGQVPSWRCVRGNQSMFLTLMFLSLSFSLPPPLSKNQ